MKKDLSSQENMHYGACPKKVESRSEVIINTYRNHYKNNSIQSNSQYWTICGKCAYNGILEENCEPDQIIKSKLARPNQIHGVEILESIHQENLSSGLDINWHLGDFYEILSNEINEDDFHPAIVNADLLMMPKKAASYFARLMQLLSFTDKETMLVVNLVKEFRHFRSDMNDFVEELEKSPNFQLAMNKAKWNFNEEYYWYNGTGNTTTNMMSLIVFKEGE